MMSPVLAISGAIASGKTTIARYVASAVGWPWTSFGAYVRAEAERRGFPDDRPTLQRLGDELVAHGIESFCRAVLVAAGWSPGSPAVLDGVRHVAVVQALRDLVAPQPLVLVYVTVPADVRATRLQVRGVGFSAQQQHDAHANEADVLTSLPQMADVVLDGSLPPHALLASLSRALPMSGLGRIGE